jgi:hypothetical protein
MHTCMPMGCRQEKCLTGKLILTCVTCAVEQKCPNVHEHNPQQLPGCTLVLVPPFASRCVCPCLYTHTCRPQHNDFVLDWSPLRLKRRTAATDNGAASQQGQQQPGAAGGAEEAALPAFARDLLAILCRQLEVRYETGSSAQTAAAVAALERAAGLPQLHQQGGAAPRPLSRL